MLAAGLFRITVQLQPTDYFSRLLFPNAGDVSLQSQAYAHLIFAKRKHYMNVVAYWNSEIHAFLPTKRCTGPSSFGAALFAKSLLQWRMSHCSKKREGGQQQRLQAHRQEMEAAAPTKDQPCLLAEWLKERWAWGPMSPQIVQHVASVAKKDILSPGIENVPASLQQLARLGTSGAFPNNYHRDFMAVMQQAL